MQNVLFCHMVEKRVSNLNAFFWWGRVSWGWAHSFDEVNFPLGGQTEKWEAKWTWKWIPFVRLPSKGKVGLGLF